MIKTSSSAIAERPRCGVSN